MWLLGGGGRKERTSSSLGPGTGNKTTQQIVSCPRDLAVSLGIMGDQCRACLRLPSNITALSYWGGSGSRLIELRPSYSLGKWILFRCGLGSKYVVIVTNVFITR